MPLNVVPSKTIIIVTLVGFFLLALSSKKDVNHTICRNQILFRKYGGKKLAAWSHSCRKIRCPFKILFLKLKKIGSYLALDILSSSFFHLHSSYPAQIDLIKLMDRSKRSQMG